MIHIYIQSSYIVYYIFFEKKKFSLDSYYIIEYKQRRQMLTFLIYTSNSLCVYRVPADYSICSLDLRQLLFGYLPQATIYYVMFSFSRRIKLLFKYENRLSQLKIFCFVLLSSYFVLERVILMQQTVLIQNLCDVEATAVNRFKDI